MANKNNNNELGNGRKRRLNVDLNLKVEMQMQLPVFEEDETIEEKRAKLRDQLDAILWPDENEQNGLEENLASDKEPQRKEDKIAEANALKFLCKNSFEEPEGFQFDGGNLKLKFAVLSAENDSIGFCVGHQHSNLMEWLLGKRINQTTKTEHSPAAAEDIEEEITVDVEKERNDYLDIKVVVEEANLAQKELHEFIMELQKKEDEGQLDENGEWEKELAKKEEKVREYIKKMKEMEEESERREQESERRIRESDRKKEELDRNLQGVYKEIEMLEFAQKAFQEEIFSFNSAEEHEEEGILLECEESSSVEEDGENKKKKFLAIKGDLDSFNVLASNLFNQFTKDTIPCDYHVMFQSELDIAKAFKEKQKLPFGLPQNWSLKIQERNSATNELFQFKVSGKGKSYLMQTSGHLQIDIKRGGDLAQWGDEEMRDGDYNFGKKVVEKKG